MDVPNTFHIGSITASTENHCNAYGGVDIRQCNEGVGGVVDERRQLVYILRRSHVNSLPEKRRTNTDVVPQARIDTKSSDGTLAPKFVACVSATPRSYVPVYRDRVREFGEFGHAWRVASVC